jgi:YggT family protein
MDALIFIVRSVLQVLLVTVFLLRFLLPLVRADARNPLSQAVLRITNPLVLPLRRVIPAAGRIDTASLVALLLVQLVTTAIVFVLMGIGLARPGALFQSALLSLALTVLQFYKFAVLIYVILSWVAPGTYSPSASLLASLCEPLLRPVRRIIPPLAGLDLSAIFVLIGLQALEILIT